MNYNLLLISNSTNAGEPYLQWPLAAIGSFLRDAGVREAAFVPYAAVSFSYDEYEQRVAARFNELGVELHSVHRSANPAATLAEAQAIVVGGGNTFHLLKTMQEQGLPEVIRRRTAEGVPYVGWSAGSNVVCPTICTTNDMPIVEPASFAACALVPFQINPHYLDAHPEGHGGETREQRIAEYVAANPDIYVAGLREGGFLQLADGTLSLHGTRPLRVFGRGMTPCEFRPGEDISFLLK